MPKWWRHLSSQHSGYYIWAMGSWDPCDWQRFLLCAEPAPSVPRRRRMTLYLFFVCVIEICANLLQCSWWLGSLEVLISPRILLLPCCTADDWLRGCVEVLICSRIPNCCRYRKKDPTKLLILLTNYKL
jgi:hypothetical protein